MRPVRLIIPALALAAAACAPDSPESPNILFIAIDDLKPTLGAYGDTMVHSPTLDRLADEGTVFLNNHCQFAVCGPSRASLLTGMYPDRNRVWGFYSIREHCPGVVTLPQYFKQHGYTTVNISKVFDQRTVDRYWDSLSWSKTAFPLSEEQLIPWFNKKTGPVTTYFYQSDRVKAEFARRKAEAEAQDKHPIRYTQQFIKPATECLEMPDDAYKDGVFAKKAIADLEMLAGEGHPFFLAVGFERPHLPWTAPKRYWDLYDRSQIDTAACRDYAVNDLEYFYHTSNELRSYTDEEGNDRYGQLAGGIPLPVAEQKKLIHGYYAAVSYIDRQVGKILARLEELGLAGNTIVVVWGDHGWHLGDHGMWGKATNFEQATRSPLIIRVPGEEPQRVDQPTEFVDLYPTLCDLAGLPPREGLSGYTLTPLLEGKPDTLNTAALSQYTRGDRMGYAIRTHRYRYVEWMEEGRHVNDSADYSRVHARQLFDYRYDPLETVNIVEADSMQAIRQKLARQLHALIN